MNTHVYLKTNSQSLCWGTCDFKILGKLATQNWVKHSCISCSFTNPLLCCISYLTGKHLTRMTALLGHLPGNQFSLMIVNDNDWCLIGTLLAKIQLIW